MSDERNKGSVAENESTTVNDERKENVSSESEKADSKKTDEVVAGKETGADIVGITDDDIEEMSVDELAKTVERPRKNTDEKMFSKTGGKADTKQSKGYKQNSAKRFWRKYKGLIIFLILVIIGIILFLSFKKKTEEAMALMSQPEIEYALVEKQDIRDTISTTGTIVSKKTSQVISSFRESTKITNVYYEVGDHVNEGDVIVTYSTENIEKNIANKKEDIADNRKEAALNAEDTERTYIDSYGKVSYDLQSSNEDVENKLKALYEACDGYGDAKRALDAFRSNPDEYRKEHPGATEEGLQASVSAAYQREQDAQKLYNDAVASLANINRTSTSSLASAETSKEKAALNAQKTAKQLERELENYEDSLDDYIVTAPISGIVTKVDVEEGNGFTTGNVMTIQRDDILDITTEIDEYDIPFVKEGQRVVIKTDATQDDELEGEVISIAPTATTSSSGNSTGQSTGGVTYTVKIEIKTKDERLKLGMSAKINIITEERADILVVRYDAIEEDVDGHYIRVVDNTLPAPSSEDKNKKGFGKKSKDSESDNGIAVVGVDGQPTGSPESEDVNSNEPPSRKVYVEIGIEGDYYTQIISDEISEGMQVLVTSDFEVMDPFAMMMGGGRPGGR